MKIKYYAPKNARIKKGTTKIKGDKHRRDNFCGLTMISDNDNSWWCEDLNKWCTLEEAKGLDFSTHNDDIKSFKSAISHIKCHPELKKGTIMNLNSNFNLLLCKILPSSIGGRWIALAGRQHITYYTFLVLIQLLHQVALTAVF